MRLRQFSHHFSEPLAPAPGQQRRSRLLAQRAVPGQHSGAGARVQTLMRRVDITQSRRAIDDVVPGGCGTAAIAQRLAQVQVRDCPGRVTHALRTLAQQLRRVLQHALGHQHRQRDDALLRLPAFDSLRCDVPGIHFDAPASLRDPQHHTAWVQALAQRRSQPSREPAVAFRPGQHGVAFRRLIARRLEAMTAREVMNAGPGRYGGDPRAVVVAAAIVQIPAQAGIGQPFAIQPLRESGRVERPMAGGRRLRCRNRETCLAPGAVHQVGKAAVLRQRCLAHTLQRKEALLPRAFEEQPLLRCVAKMAFVVDPAACHALAQSQLFQQVLHFARIVARHRQVVRASGQAMPPTSPPRLLPPAASSSSSSAKSSMPALPQRPRRREPGHAGAGDQDPHAAGRRGRRPRTPIPQQMPALRAGAAQRAGHLRRIAAAQQRERGAAQHGAARDLS